MKMGPTKMTIQSHFAEMERSIISYAKISGMVILSTA